MKALRRLVCRLVGHQLADSLLLDAKWCKRCHEFFGGTITTTTHTATFSREELGL